MKNCAKLSLALFVTFAGAIFAAIAAMAQQQSISLSGKVLGASGNHSVYVALWDQSGFLTKPAQQIRIEAHSDTGFHFQVAPGSWAISAYEDTNENGKLDFGLFGPKEPNGFWRPFHEWHKPRFSEVSSTVDKDTPNADVELRK